MKYSIKLSALAESFSLPKVVAEKYLKLASENQLKVLLYIMCNISAEIDAQNISAATAVSKSDVEDALVFWAQADILLCENAPKKEQVKQIKVSAPTREDISRRGLEDERLAFLLREAQLKFGRALKQNESSMLVSLYDDCGLDVAVILLLLQYAAEQKKLNKTFVEKTAQRWINSGVETVIDAEKIITETVKEDLAWGVVCRVFGIERRKPTDKEAKAANLWINEWNLSEDILHAAYDAGVNATSKFSFAYVASIIEKWHKSGVKTVADIEAKTKKKTGKKETSYDLDLFEEMLNKD